MKPFWSKNETILVKRPEWFHLFLCDQVGLLFSTATYRALLDVLQRAPSGHAGVVSGLPLVGCADLRWWGAQRRRAALVRCAGSGELCPANSMAAAGATPGDIATAIAASAETCSHCGNQGVGFKRCSHCKQASYWYASTPIPVPWQMIRHAPAGRLEE